MKLLALLLTLLVPLPSFADDAPDTKAADIEHMKKIGAGLNAYKKARGEFPDHLSDLVPDFLDAKTLVSPRSLEHDSRAAAREYDPKLPCAYSYEFSTDPFREEIPGEHGLTVRALRTFQLEEVGSTVPLLRCFLYGEPLNLSHAGDIYESPIFSDESYDWVLSEEASRLRKANGIGPGGRDGNKFILTFLDEAGHPAAGVSITADRGAPLPRREYISDAEGKMTIPLGFGAEKGVDYERSTAKDWYVSSAMFRFGGAGNPPFKNRIATATQVAHPAASIGGIIRDPQGAPLPGAKVRAYAANELPDEEYSLTKAITDQRGAWTLEGIPKNVPVVLHLSHPGFRLLRGQPGTGSVPRAADLFAHTAEVRLAALYLLKGDIHTAGQPVPAAKVLLHLDGEGYLDFAGQAVADAQGHFEVRVNGEGHATAIVFADHLAPLTQPIVLSAEGPPLALTMNAGRPLKGRVVQGKRIGVPNTPILLSMFLDDDEIGLPENPVIATTDAEGRFVWLHAPKNHLECRIFSESGAPVDISWDTTKEDEKIMTVQ
jgi:hypothetical protein